MRAFRIYFFSLLAAGLLAAGASLLQPSAAQAADPVYTGTFSSLAVDGHDPVAYFTMGKPVEGSADYEYEWNGATWRFASQENLESFKADPEKFAPQYGGYCAWAVSQGYTASADPDAWKIVDGKLYLNYSKDVQQRWSEDIPGNIAKADGNWPKVIE
ncbi:MAG: YHS domain-containing (seleno)protein [Limibacillus sp.]|jgi:YHS domain-containing protein